MPLSRAADGTITTQFTMTTLEELGLLKMDFLGLRTLTVIQNAQKLAEKTAGHAIDMMKIDFNDPKVLQMIGSGKCEGVFQLESAGMKNFMKELKPQSLEDIIAGFPCTVPAPWTLSPSTSGERIIRRPSVRLPAAEAYSGTHPMAVLSIRNRSCRLSGIWQAIRWAAAIWSAVPCPRKKPPSWKRSAGILFTEIPKRECRAASAGELDEKTANKIYDEMIDFAKYAFNKSPRGGLCHCLLSDCLAEILLSGGIYGCPDDLLH